MQVLSDLIIGATAGIASAALYAVAVVIYKSQREEIRPAIITAIRMWVVLPLMAFLLFLPFVQNPLSIPLESTLLLALSIILLVVIGDTIYLTSQERIGVSLAFPISMSFPILTYFLAIVFLSDTLVLSRLFGIIVTITGLILITRDQNPIEEEHDSKQRIDILGITLAIFAAVLYASGTVALEASITDVDPITANFIMILCGSVVFVPLLSVAKVKGIQMPSRRSSKIIAITGLFDLGLSFLLIIVAVKYVGATIASVLSSIAPLFAVPISVFYLNEHATKSTALGVLATVIGIILVIAGI
ncbi:MAG: DMT family transporter [Candidatus Thorarchaeota archaeon]